MLAILQQQRRKLFAQSVAANMFSAVHDVCLSRKMAEGKGCESAQYLAAGGLFLCSFKPHRIV